MGESELRDAAERKRNPAGYTRIGPERYSPQEAADNALLADAYLTHPADDALRDKAEAGERFKSFCHSYLDARGVPHGDPESPHQVQGCRIGARLALVFAERDRLRAALKRIQEWDCLNPPNPDLCHDHPWLKRTVDDALAGKPYDMLTPRGATSGVPAAGGAGEG